ncbi:MAG: hypothetical protein P4L99_19870 [Chthoniobacter sp.]|nr:hypothetical protein [Chthoniobacter sp.]
MKDQDIINEAYQDAVKKLFAVFYTSLIDAGNNQGQIDAAKQNFKAGIAKARSSRDAAIALL